MADRGADALGVAHTFRLVFNRRLDASIIVGARVEKGRLITRVGIGDGQAHRAPRGKEERYDHDKISKIQSARFHAMMKRHFCNKNKAARILFLAHMRFSAVFLHILRGFSPFAAGMSPQFHAQSSTQHLAIAPRFFMVSSRWSAHFAR